ncbi:MAG: DNRLRE domain-containing protein [Chloroflexota bacterium]
MKRLVLLSGGVVLTAALAMRVGVTTSLSLTSQTMTPYRTCIVSGTPASTTAVADASVRQLTATSNFGTSTTNDIASSLAQNRRLYIRFDYSTCSPAIPASATVRLATLRMYVSALPAACRTLDLFRVTASWTESGVTWNNQPFGTTVNNPPTANRSGSFDVGTPVGCQNRVAGFTTGAVVTADVAAWIAGSATNYGWMVRDDVENSATARTSTFSAKDLGTTAQAPELVITYVTVP